MKQIIHNLLLGMGSILLAPSGNLVTPGLRITLPPENATDAIASDFARIAGDLDRSIERIRSEKQMELKF